MYWTSVDYKNPADSLVYYADLALVTVADVCSRKRSSAVEKRRHIDIAAALLYDVCRYRPLMSPSDSEAYRHLATFKDVWAIVKLAQSSHPRPLIETIRLLVERWSRGELNQPSGKSG